MKVSALAAVKRNALENITYGVVGSMRCVWQMLWSARTHSIRASAKHKKVHLLLSTSLPHSPLYLLANCTPNCAPLLACAVHPRGERCVTPCQDRAPHAPQRTTSIRLHSSRAW
jgi:hypothetical protein